MGANAILSMLAEADRPRDRKHAVATALANGMPLYKIEEYLDWIDAVRRTDGANRSPTADEAAGPVICCNGRGE
jgi:hypothetical protein